jgi:capsular polysaccharide biosynthesis protein
MTLGGIAVRVLLVAVVAAGAALAALLLSNRQDPVYEASTQLLIGASVRPELQILGPPFSGDGTDNEIRMSTEATLANSHLIALRTAREQPELDMDADEVNRRVTATATANTQVLRITATGTSRARAELLLSAYRKEYLALRREQERERAADVVDALEQRLDRLPADEADGPMGAALRNQLNALESLQEVGSEPEVVDPVRAASEPASPKTRRNVLFGLLFGLALGIGLVALRSEIDRRHPEEQPRGDGVARKREHEEELFSETSLR